MGDDPGRPLISLGTGRPHWSCRARRTCRSGRSSRTGRSNRPRKAAVLYHHIFRIRPGSDLDDAGGGKLWSNPPKPSGRSAFDLHCLAWADFDLHVGLARSSNPSYDYQLAPRYVGSRDQYLCMRIFTPRDHAGGCDRCNSADKLCEHGKLSCHNPEFNHHSSMRTRTRLRQVERGLSKRSEFSATTALTREAQRNDLKAMLIYLNAVIESWKTANDRFSDAGLVGPRRR